MNQISGRMSILSIILGIVVTIPWSLWLGFGIPWGIADWGFSRILLSMILIAVSGFIVPWGLAQLIARLIKHLKSSRRHAS